MTSPSAPMRPRRVWDIVITVVLLACYLLVTAIASFAALLLAFAGDSCGTPTACNNLQLTIGMNVALMGVFLPLPAVAIVAIVLMTRRRLAFWVPLAGCALTVGLTVLGWAIAIGSAPPS